MANYGLEVGKVVEVTNTLGQDVEVRLMDEPARLEARHVGKDWKEAYTSDDVDVEGGEGERLDGWQIVVKGAIVCSMKDAFGYDQPHINMLVEEGVPYEKDGITIQENKVVRPEPTGWRLNTIVVGTHADGTQVGDETLIEMGFTPLTDVAL